MMFGTREEFEYLECNGCGTLQISEVPDLAPHYPAEYLSLGDVDDIYLAGNWRRRVAARIAGGFFRSGRGLIGRLVVERKPDIAVFFPESLLPVPLRPDSRILDVGCGTGRLLQILHYYGFTDLSGADAFIARDIAYPSGVRIKKASLAELEGKFDLIMLHHSFEHLPSPQDAIENIHRLLAHDGTALIRMPVTGFAWEKYGVNWVQLDPPRHLFLFSERAFTRLAEEAGFAVEKVIYDSTAFQFWGSEQYLLDIPLNNPRSHNQPDGGEVFDTKQIEAWQRQADELNVQGRGDQACFYLRKI